MKKMSFEESFATVGSWTDKLFILISDHWIIFGIMFGVVLYYAMDWIPRDWSVKQ
jgi:hypothetical protein